MKGDVTKYLLDYKHGKIKKGLGIDCPLDDSLRFKPKQLNIILGHDNVGKTYFINWYFFQQTDLDWNCYRAGFGVGCFA